MGALIHPAAHVDPGAELGSGVAIGAFSVVDPGVRIGDRTRISSHCRVIAGTTVGSDCAVGTSAVLGGAPQDRGYRDQESGLAVGDRVLVGEFATVNRGDVAKDGPTVVGDDCMIMGYCHVGHNCKLGQGVVLTNLSQLAGHVRIEDFGWLSAAAMVHQFVTIGAMAFIAAKAEVRCDVPPYVVAEGGRKDFAFRAVNTEGMRRRRVPPESVAAVRRAFRILFRRDGANLADAVAAVRGSDLGADPYVANLVDHVAGALAGLKNRAVEGARAAGR